MQNNPVSNIDVLGLTVDFCGWPEETERWLRKNCAELIKRAKERNLDPRDLANSLMEENGTTNSGWTKWAIDTAQDTITGWNAYVGHGLNQVYQNYVQHNGFRNGDIGPANININAAISTLSRAELYANYSNLFQGVSDYVMTDAGAIDIGPPLGEAHEEDR